AVARYLLPRCERDERQAESHHPARGRGAAGGVEMTDLAVDVVERAAILELDGGLDRDAAEKQAIGELLDQLRQRQRPPTGIVGELIDAGARCWHPDVQVLIGDAGLLGCRAPLWGLDSIVFHNRNRYRPALPGEVGAAAIIVPIGVDRVDDLVAQNLKTGLLY